VVANSATTAMATVNNKVVEIFFDMFPSFYPVRSLKIGFNVYFFAMKLLLLLLSLSQNWRELRHYDISSEILPEPVIALIHSPPSSLREFSIFTETPM
jgi:hypothetical protein